MPPRIVTQNQTQEEKHWARRPFQYGQDNLERGQIFSLSGQRNDEKLLRLGYVSKVDTKTEEYQCGVCGKTFIDLGSRDGHGKTGHRRRPLSPEEEDAELDRQERFLEQVAPLNLEKTLASAKV